MISKNLGLSSIVMLEHVPEVQYQIPMKHNVQQAGQAGHQTIFHGVLFQMQQITRNAINLFMQQHAYI